MNNFINKVTSYYSLLDSTISIDALINKCLSHHNKHVLLADNNMSACFEFYFKATSANLKPIIGLQINFKNNEYLLIAKNNNGFKALLKISSFDKTDSEYNLIDYCDDLIVILRKGTQTFKTANFYLSHELAINEVKYLEPNEINVYKTLVAIKNEISLKDVEINVQQHFLSQQEAYNIFDNNLIDKTYKLLSECEWTISDCSYKLPSFKTTNNVPSKKYLTDMCLSNLQKKLKIDDGLISKKYADRLKYELDIIDKMNFNDYFLIVQDFINYAKNNNILIGPGRGSAAGSLVSYALNITEIDPIKNNLYFERFLNPERTSLPDIDVDVMDVKRQELIDYTFNKYGINQTCYIATFQRIKAKMAIRDVGRCLNIELKTIDNITKLIKTEYDENIKLAIENNEDLKSFYKLYPELFNLSHSLINIPRQFSTHAAGIVIAPDAIENYMAVQKGIDNWHLSQCSMEYVEKIGLVKIDILGLKNLSIIYYVCDLIYKNHNQKINLMKIDTNDKHLFHEITQANTIGIFQLESPGMRSTLRKVKVDSIEDISIVSALFRPGPQAMINDYVKTKRHEIEEKYLNDDVKQILKPTLGFCIYQEQVIELIKKVAGFSSAEADIFRRAIAKKKSDVFIKMKNHFITSAIKRGYSEKIANEIYEFLWEFANYGFNHSHSLAYAYISYQMMFLKYYYPLEFHLTLLQFGDSSNDKNFLYISEARKYNIKIYNVNILYSNINFDQYNNGIIFGFANIKGIGHEIAKKIINIRSNNKFDTYISCISSLTINGINKKTIEALIKVGAFDIFNIDRAFLLKNLDEIIENAAFKFDDNKFVFGIELKECQKMDEKTKAEYETYYLNFSFSNNDWEYCFNKYQQQYNLEMFNVQNTNRTSNYLLKINAVKLRKTKNNNEMLFVNFNIEHTSYETPCFKSNIFEQIKPNTYLVANVKLDQFNKPEIINVVSVITDI